AVGAAVTGHVVCVFFFFKAEDGIRDGSVTGVQTCALPIWSATTVRVSPPATRARRTNAAIDCASGPASSKVALAGGPTATSARRSEERRVGKECRSRGGGEDEEKKEGEGRGRDGTQVWKRS